jgi:hypothetical protein
MISHTLVNSSPRSIVDRIYPHEEAAAAHHRVETEQRMGAIVLADKQ